MQYFRAVIHLSVLLALSSCETPIGQSWNNAVSRLSPQPDDSDARNGLNGSGRSTQPRQTTQNIDSDTIYLGPKPTPRRVQSSGVNPGTTGGTVKLKPFRSSASSERSSPSPAMKKKDLRAVFNPSPTPKATPKAEAKTTPKTTPKPSPKSSDLPTPKSAPKSATEPVSEATPKPKTEDAPPPFASPVPGKKGYVTSPYSPDAGFIDVTGLDPGSLARDPYSGKVFRVP